MPDRTTELKEILPESWLPKRIKRCPVCRDNEHVQMIVFGMPAGRPPPGEEDRIYFAGCVIVSEVDQDGNLLPEPRWRCPSCERFYS